MPLRSGKNELGKIEGTASNFALSRDEVSEGKSFAPSLVRIFNQSKARGGTKRASSGHPLWLKKELPLPIKEEEFALPPAVEELMIASVVGATRRAFAGERFFLARDSFTKMTRDSSRQMFPSRHRYSLKVSKMGRKAFPPCFFYFRTQFQ